MTGGEITTNNATSNGGGVCLNDGTMLLNGTVNITSNTRTDSSASNVFLVKSAKDNTITIGQNFNTATTEKIGVHASTTPDCKDYVNATRFANVADAKDISEYFKADVDKEGVVYNNDMVQLFGPHNPVEMKTTPPTCLDDGYDEHWKCTVCNNTFTDKDCTTPASVTFYPATGHDYGEWEDTQKPSYTTTGIRKRVCKNNSSHIETEIIPMLISNTDNSDSSNSDNSENSDNSSNTGDNSSNTGDSGTADNSIDSNDSSDGGLGNVPNNPTTGIAITLAPFAAAIIAFTVTVKRNKK